MIGTDSEGHQLLGDPIEGQCPICPPECVIFSYLFFPVLTSSQLLSAPLSSSQLSAALVSSSHRSNLLHSLRSQLFSAPKLDLSANPEKVPSLSFSKRHVKRNMKCAIEEKFSKNSSLQLWRSHFKKISQLYLQRGSCDIVRYRADIPGIHMKCTWIVQLPAGLHG